MTKQTKDQNGAQDAKNRERKAVRKDGDKAYTRPPFQLMR